MGRLGESGGGGGALQGGEDPELNIGICEGLLTRDRKPTSKELNTEEKVMTSILKTLATMKA